MNKVVKEGVTLFKCKKAQVTIFIIIGFLIIASAVSYVVLKNRTGVRIPKEFRPVEEYFISCLENVLREGVSIAEEQGGYIELPKFEPGSSYMPTSNMLDFFGTPIPFWYYVSGNNIVKEQVPKKSDVENQLKNFIENNFYCDFSDFSKQGFDISTGKINVKKIKIENNRIKGDVIADLKITFNNKTINIKKHKIEMKSKFGKFLNIALKLYEYEKKTAFLENYTIDILYLYAPVSGVELTCSPKIWFIENVSNKLKEAIKNNFIFLRPISSYYNVRDKEDKYFIFNFKSDEAIRFLYSEKWPTKIEAEPNNNGLLIAEPIGNQPGLGIIGFCYVPYHFVYNLVVPVVIQIYDDNEFFQFPIVIIVNRNKPRNTALVESYYGKPEICNHKTKDITIYTYDEDLKPVSAKLSFKCLNEICDIGNSEDGVLYGKVPACVNGFVIAEAEGYKDEKYKISTNEENVAYLVMKKLHPTNVIVKSEGKIVKYNALIYFISDDYSQTLYWPKNKKVLLAEGYYNISVFVYKNSTIILPESKVKKCVDVKKGLSGLFGVTRKECFDVVIPQQTLNNVVVGGGKINEYLTKDELNEGIEIDVGKLHVPKSLEELQNNYNLIDTQKIMIK